ncbi:MAG TPA: zinc ribbon domain-containing protein [Firmicutes bacterium]|nr:zinc ribbon domain-containing protein [Bacillota bacterium]
MPFMDDLSKNVNALAQTTKKKSGEILELTKLNIELNTAKVDLSDLYERIGVIVYANRIKNIQESPEILELLKLIDVQLTKIKGIEKQMDAVKNVRTCEHCKRVISPDVKYCPYCNAPQSDNVNWVL